MKTEFTDFRNGTTESEDSRLVAAIDEYLAALDAGEPIPRDEFLARYPAHAAALRQCLESLEFIRHATPAYSREHRSPLGEHQQLGDFRLVRELGRGGMGIVYEAEQLSLGRPVAVKILPFAALLDQRQLERFKNEARAAAMLKHPNIVSVHSVGVQRGVHHYAMELIDGMSLAEVILQLPTETVAVGPVELPAAIPVDAACQLEHGADTQPIARLSTQRQHQRKDFYRSVARLGSQAAQALHYAHGEGVLHRDIKPSNLLLDRDGNLHIADFGLARIQTGDNLTMSGDVVGTLRYMSPEQLDERSVPDGRTDVYSLGLTLYELVTGQPAISGSSRQQMIQDILEKSPAPPSHKDASLPADLETIILTSIAPETADRYVSAGALADDLSRFLESRPILARRRSHWSSLQSWCRRNPMVAALAGLIVSILTLAVIVSLTLAQQWKDESEFRRSQLYARSMLGVAEAINEGDYLAAQEHLIDWVPDRGQPDLRGFEWFYLWNRNRALAPELIIPNAWGVYAVAYSLDGKSIYSTSWGSEVFEHDALTGKRLQTLFEPQGGDVRVLEMHHDSSQDIERLYTANWDGSIVVWDTESGEVVERFDLPEEVTGRRISDLATSPEGKWTAVVTGHQLPMLSRAGSEPAGIHVINHETKQWQQLSGSNSGLLQVAFCGAGESLAAASFAGELIVWSTESWQVVQRKVIGSHAVTALAVSSDGQLLATATAQSESNMALCQIDTWEVGNWQHISRQEANVAYVRCLDFSPDGKLIAIGGEDHSLVVGSTYAGQTLSAGKRHTADVLDVCFSPAGETLVSVSGDNTHRSWQLSQLLGDSPQRTEFTQHEDFVSNVAFTKADDAAWSIDFQGNAFQWSTNSGKVLNELKLDLPAGHEVRLAVLPNGPYLSFAIGKWPQQVEGARWRLYDLRRQEFVASIPLPEGCLTATHCVSPDSQLVAMSSGQSVVIIDVESRQQLASLGPFEQVANGIAFSPDSRSVAVSIVAGQLRTFDPRTGRKLAAATVPRQNNPGAIYSPDGKSIATGGADRIRLYDASTLKLIRSFQKSPDWTLHVDFSTDGSRILSGGKDGVARLWDVATGEMTLELTFVRNWIWNGQFSPTGNSLAVACEDVATVFHAGSIDACRQLNRKALRRLYVARDE